MNYSRMLGFIAFIGLCSFILYILKILLKYWYLGFYVVFVSFREPKKVDCFFVKCPEKNFFERFLEKKLVIEV